MEKKSKKKYVGIFILLLSLFIVAPSYASIFETAPSVVQIHTGETATLSVLVTSTDAPINAVSGVIKLPQGLQLISVATDDSIIQFWLQKPELGASAIPFSGIVIGQNGFTGTKGKVFSITVKAQKTGSFPLQISQGSVLAANGAGTETLNTVKVSTLVASEKKVATIQLQDAAPSLTPEQIAYTQSISVPVITNYSETVASDQSVHIQGIANPNSTVHLQSSAISFSSIGDRLVNFFRTKKSKLDSTYVATDTKGVFEYVSPSSLLAGVYNVTPFEVGQGKEVAGASVHIAVTEQLIIHILVYIINALALVIPIVVLIMIIWFIPWYGKRFIHLLSIRFKKKEIQEEKM